MFGHYLILALLTTLAACSGGKGDLQYDGNNPTALSLSPSNSVMALNSECKFRAFATFVDGRHQDVTEMVSWEADDVGEAEARKGFMKFTHTGSGRVRARWKSFSSETPVRVTNATLTQIEVYPVNKVMPQDSGQQFQATGFYSDGTRHDITSQVTWTSSQAAVADISDEDLSKGMARGFTAGATVIKAEWGGISGQTNFSVNAATLISLRVDPAVESLAKGVEKDFKATGTYSDGSTADLSSVVTWQSSSPGRALVDNAVHRGRVKALSTGQATIKASFNNLEAEAEVQITNATLVSLEISPNGLNLALRTSQTITLTGVYSDGSTANLTGQAQWSTSDSSIISVNNTGTLTAVALGNASVSATFGGRTETITVAGTNATLSAVEVTPVLVSLPLGQTVQLSATGRFSDNSTQDLTAIASWSSADVTKATVSNAGGSAGLVSPIAVGQLQVSATYGGFTGSADVQITSAVLVSVSLSQTQVTVANGSNSVVSAWALYSDGTMTDVSASVQWSSSDNGVATVGNTVGSYGSIHGVGVGSATITGSFSGQTAQLTVTISAAQVASVQITPSSISLPLGAQGNMIATATYTDGTTSDVTANAVWSSDNTGVVTVSNANGFQGKVSAVAQGSANIKAVYAGRQDQVSVSVTAAVLDRIEISPQSLALSLGSSTQLTATGIYSDGSTVNLTSQTSWSTSNSAVLSVDNSGGHKGTVTATGVGSATLTATFGGVSQNLSASGSAAVLSSLEFLPSSLTLASGTSQQMRVTGIYSDGSTVDLTSMASWSSSNTAVMSVNNSGANRGVVTSIAPGSATLSVNYQGVSATMSTSMTNAVLSSLQISPATLSIPLGNTANFSVSGQFSDGSVQDLTNEATWSSSNTAVATVSNAAGVKGHLETQSTGSAQISASARGQSISASVTVSAATLTSVSVSVATVSLPLGTNTRVTAWGHYSDGSSVDITNSAVWDSNSSNASVGNSAGNFGKITGLGQGSAVVTATLLSYSAQVDVTITSASLASIQVNAVATSLPKGLQTQFSAVGTYSDGSTADLTSSVLWSSSSTSVAAVSNAGGSKGLVTASNVGTSTIKAALNGAEGTQDFTVTAATLDRIEFFPATLTLARGLTQQMSATGVYTDGSTADLSSSVAWSSSNSAIVAVSNTAGSKGLVTAAGNGSATLSGTLGGVSHSMSVSVTPATLVSIAVSGVSAPMPKGTTRSLTATGTYTDGSTQNITTSASWSSSDATILSVSNTAGSKGSANGLAVGQATVTAALSGVSGTRAIDVSAAQLSSITVTPGTPSVALGLTLNLVATGTYTDASTANLTSLATWSSSASGTASVSNSAGTKGRVSGVLQGNATITASYDGSSGDTVVSVTAATLQSISIAGLTTGLPKGLTRQLTATGHYSDGSTADITSSVTWSSDNSSVASISNAAGTKGRFTSLGVGTAQVTATLGGVSHGATATGIAAILQSIAVTPGEVWIPIAVYYQFTATGTYSDGTTANITTSVLWTTSDVLLMTIDNAAPHQGRARGVAVGAGTFTATLGSISGTAIFHGVLF